MRQNRLKSWFLNITAPAQPHNCPRPAPYCPCPPASNYLLPVFTALFSRAHATLHFAVLVAMSISRFITFFIQSSFGITAPAQPSATGLPCIWPCYFRNWLSMIIDGALSANMTPKSTMGSIIARNTKSQIIFHLI